MSRFLDLAFAHFWRWVFTAIAAWVLANWAKVPMPTFAEASELREPVTVPRMSRADHLAAVEGILSRHTAALDPWCQATVDAHMEALNASG